MAESPPPLIPPPSRGRIIGGGIIWDEGMTE